jgi:serine/threonine protein kinase
MELVPGTVFAGDYRVVRRLSAGGMGAVFVAEQLSTGKQRALKTMHRELVYDPASRQRFEQEARIGSRIASEHVVEVQAAGVDQTTQLPYLVMELLEGEDMHTRLQRGPFTPSEAAMVLEQLAHALGAAHDANVVHRDLKPENIFLGVPHRTGASLMVKVLDFGIAKVSEGRNTTSASGTPMWLSPEQTTRGVITPAADVWAMGLLVFDMLVGRVFWRSGDGPNQSIAGLLTEIMMDPIPPASQRAAEYGKTLPPGFDAWFARCVVRDAAQRFPNARAAFADLAPILRGQLMATQAQPSLPQPIPPTLQSPYGPPPAPYPPQPMYAQPYPQPVPPPTQKKSGCGSIVLMVLVFLLLLGAGVAYGIYVLVIKAEEAMDTTVSSLASAAASTIPAVPTVTDTSSAAPPPSASAAGTGTTTVGGMVICDEPAVQGDAQRQLNTGLATKLVACTAKQKRADKDKLTLELLVDVKPDGSVAKVQSVVPAVGPDVQCIIDTMKTSHFASSKKGAQIMFMLTFDD